MSAHLAHTKNKNRRKICIYVYNSTPPERSKFSSGVGLLERDDSRQTRSTMKNTATRRNAASYREVCSGENKVVHAQSMGRRSRYNHKYRLRLEGYGPAADLTYWVDEVPLTVNTSLISINVTIS